MGTCRIPLDRLYHCSGCGTEGVVRLDKYKYPFWSCSVCGLRVFMKSQTAQIGFMVLQRWLKSTHERFRQAVLLAEAKGRKEYIEKVRKAAVEA